MDDFLSKPVSEAILSNTLKRWFPGAALGDEKSGMTAIADGDAGAAFRQMQGTFITPWGKRRIGGGFMTISPVLAIRHSII
jgi:hypothetical protein